jgi:hypothetical protein
LRRLLGGGDEDLVADSRRVAEQAQVVEESTAATTARIDSSADVSVGGGTVVDPSGDYVTIRTDAPGFDEQTLEVERAGTTLRVRGRGAEGATKAVYDENITLTAAGVQAAEVTFDGSHIVVRVLKSSLKPEG